jgi:hypothetical protein
MMSVVVKTVPEFEPRGFVDTVQIQVMARRWRYAFPIYKYFVSLVAPVAFFERPGIKS